MRWWATLDLNQQLPRCEHGTLPIELVAHVRGGESSAALAAWQVAASKRAVRRSAAATHDRREENDLSRRWCANSANRTSFAPPARYLCDESERRADSVLPRREPRRASAKRASTCFRASLSALPPSEPRRASAKRSSTCSVQASLEKDVRRRRRRSDRTSISRAPICPINRRDPCRSSSARSRASALPRGAASCARRPRSSHPSPRRRPSMPCLGRRRA